MSEEDQLSFTVAGGDGWQGRLESAAFGGIIRSMPSDWCSICVEMVFCLGECRHGTVQALSHWWRAGKTPAGQGGH